MDGKTALRILRELLNESATSTFMDDRVSFDYLDKAYIEFVQRTDLLKTSQAITTVKDQANYEINADFLKLYLTNDEREYVVKFAVSSSDVAFPTQRSYGEIIYDNSTTSVQKPNYFGIIPQTTLDAQITGVATSAGAISGSLATLTCTTSGTQFANAAARDRVYNTTAERDGIVVSKTSDTALVTAMYPKGGWSVNDAYIIQPHKRLDLYFNPAPSTAGYTVTLYYVQKPAPVYSDYGVYLIDDEFMNGVVAYAAFLYKFRDREPDFGNMYYRMFTSEVSRANEMYTNRFKTQYWQRRVSD